MTDSNQSVFTNVTRTTFEYIRKNPGVTRPAAIDALVTGGLNSSSVSSLIGQMISQRLVRSVDGGLFANQQEYTPLRPAISKLLSLKRGAKTKAEAAPGTKWTPPEMPPIPLAPSTPAAWNSSDVIDRLNIKQARALYEELKSIFGA